MTYAKINEHRDAKRPLTSGSNWIVFSACCLAAVVLWAVLGKI